VPRIIVITEVPEQAQGSVLLDELVHSVHLSTGHAAAQLVERLAWAISDAEEFERTRSPRPRAQKAAREPAPPYRAREAIAA
jgi:hypothetical protein